MSESMPKFYIGYATDDSVRLAGQSGGLVSALLIFALEEGMIDGALITKMEKTMPESFIAKTRKEILSASGSKYCQVPVNAQIKKLWKMSGKYAVVETPCQMHGLRKLENLKPELKSKIVLHLGLFCSHITSYRAISYFAFKAGIRKKDIADFRYRDKEWRGYPGDIRFTLKNGSRKFLQRKYRGLTKPFFVPLRCKACRDNFNALSDISFGDARLPEIRNQKKGTSVLITRTELGEKLVKQAHSNGVIKILNIGRAKLMQTQGMSFKRRTGRIHALDYVNSRILSNKIAYSWLQRTPLTLLRLYARFTRITEGHS